MSELSDELTYVSELKKAYKKTKNRLATLSLFRYVALLLLLRELIWGPPDYGIFIWVIIGIVMSVTIGLSCILFSFLGLGFKLKASIKQHARGDRLPSWLVVSGSSKVNRDDLDKFGSFLSEETLLAAKNIAENQDGELPWSEVCNLELRQEQLILARSLR